MKKRAGKTEKVSISIDRDDLRLLRSRAKRLHDGNLSALMRDVAEEERRERAMSALIDALGGPILTDKDRAELDAEWAAAAAPKPKKRSRTRRAA